MDKKINKNMSSQTNTSSQTKKIKLSLEEQETLINFDEKNSTAIVETHNKKLKRLLKEYSEKSDDYVLLEDNKYSVTYRIPKDRVHIRPPKKMLSEEEKKIAGERLKKARTKQGN